MTKTLETITSIELTNACNFKCNYCVNRMIPEAGRHYQTMNGPVFELTMDVLKELVSRGTQKEVAINGIGETLLDADFIERANRIKKIIGDQRVIMSTNGALMTDRIARQIKDSGIDQCDVSVHSAYSARRAVHLMKKYEIYGQVNAGAILMPHNWAGQLEPEHTVDIHYDIECTPLKEGRGYVSVEGNISPCCYDYAFKGVFAHIADENVLEKEMSRYVLCNTCHQA
jgi:hypothetical protein